MPTFATGVAKTVAIAAEVTEGVNPVTGGKLLRRVSCDLSLNKDSYQSQEITVSQQLIDARHGVHRPAGTFSGQLSPGSFDDFWEGILRGTWTAGSTFGAHDFVFDHVAKTFTDSGGGILAAGIKKDDVVYISGATSGYTTLNNYRFRATGVTDTVITTADTLPAGLSDGTISAITFHVAGKKLFMPGTGQLFKSYTIEQYYADTDISEAFLGCKIGQTSLQLPATGLVTFNSQILSIDMVETSGTGRQLTSPAAQSTSTSLAAVNGTLRVNGTDLGIVQSMSLNLAPALQADPVVGSNVVPHIFQGPFVTTGSMAVLFTDETMSDLFRNETEFSANLTLSSGQNLQTDFMNIVLPRLKYMGNQKTDGPMALVQNFNFIALQNVSDTAHDMTTIVLQDTLA